MTLTASFRPAVPVTVVIRNRPSYSETFIQSHIKSLDAQVVAIREFFPLESPGAWRGLRRAIGAAWVNGNVARLRRRLDQARVILVEYGTTAAQALPALSRITNPVVVRFHGYDAFNTRTLERYADAYAALFRRASGIVVVSAAMRDALCAMGAPPEKVHHIVSGVDPARFRPTNVSTNTPTFLACGRFVDKKAPHLTIRAFAMALSRCPEIRLRMAGAGPLLQPCQDLVQRLGIGKQVAFLGAIGHQDVADELSRCRAFVQHSVTASNGDAEGTPNTVLEAGCCGVPVVATRHGGIPDVVEPDRTGLLVAEGDTEAMARGIERLARGADLARRLGEAAREKIVRCYSLERGVAKLNTVLAHALAVA